MTSTTSAAAPRLAAAAAALLPALLGWNVSPSPTFLNQALAFALWGAFVAYCPARRSSSRPVLLLGALGAMACAAAWSWGQGALPQSLALSATASLAAAAVLAVGGAASGATQAPDDVFAAFCWAWLFAGLVNVVLASLQVFLPNLPDGNWIAISGIPGRAVGNLRQPNHLSSLLLWSCISAVALLEMRRLTRLAAILAMAAFVFAVVLSASRTGLVSVLLLALWGLLYRKLSRPARALLLSAPLMYALAWWGMAQWASHADHHFGGTARLAESDISSSRFAIWNNTLALIRAHPWGGVGFGEFNLAWTLTPFPGRPTAFFDHTHNLPLQLAVELGLPLAALVMGLLLWALARAAITAWRAQGDRGTAQRCALLMVLMIGLHSLLEYPLWYAYFLLPTAWAFGFALQDEEPAIQPLSPGPVAWPLLPWAGWALAAGALFSVWDYSRVVDIFGAAPGAPSLEQRIARGQKSVFFAHHADYAAVTSGVPVADPAHAFDRCSHYLLDSRLMMAWARSLAERGEIDAARHLAARLREFGKADAEDFFDACPDKAVAATPGLPFQCELPVQPRTWQDFVPKR